MRFIDSKEFQLKKIHEKDSSVHLYYLGFGKNGWMDYKYYQEKIAEREASNEALTERNNIMEVEIKDLRENHESIEETARRELGYIKRDETFVRVIEKEDK